MIINTSIAIKYLAFYAKELDFVFLRAVAMKISRLLVDSDQSLLSFFSHKTDLNNLLVGLTKILILVKWFVLRILLVLALLADQALATELNRSIVILID